MARKKKDIIIRHQYSKDLKRQVIYQSTTLGKSSTKIAKSLDMNIRVVQRVLHTWKEIGEVC
jgi:transposase